MSPDQNKADALHRKALRKYETAEPGQRERYRRELEEATNEKLRADIEALRRAKQDAASRRPDGQGMHRS